MNIVTETTDAVRDRNALSAEVDRTNAALRAQQAAERQQRVLQRELAHRMKNTLAIVQAIIAQSLRRANDLQHGARLASERIAALGRAQEIITSTDAQGSDMRDVVSAAIEPHCDRPDRFVMNGESARLTSQQALGLCLAIHELSTNAVKYGALSSDTGTSSAGLVHRRRRAVQFQMGRARWATGTYARGQGLRLAVNHASGARLF